MKFNFSNTFFLLTLVVFLINGCVTAQIDVPVEVQRTFQKKYPGEKDPDWHIDSNGNFESHFKIKGKKYRADFSPDGKWIETERNIKKKNLPKAIRKILKDKYDDEKITEIEQVDHHNKGRFYDVEFKRKGKNKDVEFRDDGTIIKL